MTSNQSLDLPQASIEQLPATTRNQLRSTQILTSLPQIVSELVQNALDAGARQVEVGVDCREWTCWIRDNGGGITKEGMNRLGIGSEVGRYNTSKAYSPDSLGAVSTFGFRGEALASAADISCLEISSRTSRSLESWSIIVKGGKSLYNGPSVRWRRESPGTVVCIRDAFYNLPIRRLSHPSPARTLELIRQEIETYALVFSDVSFSLEDTNNAAAAGTSSKDRIVRIPKTSSTLATFRHIYGRALAQHVDEINATSGDMKLEGFISLAGAHSKAYQFLYVNRHPIATCDLHRVIDIRFHSSSFMRNAYDDTGETGLPRSTVRRSPRKAEKKPIYVLNLTIPPQDIDNTIEPAKVSVQFQHKDDVASLVDTVIRSFLIKHGFLTENEPDRRRTRSDESPSPSPSKRRRIFTESEAVHDNLSRIPLPSLCADRVRSDSAPLYIHKIDNLNDDNDNKIVWKDPATGEAFVVDKRTGHSYPRRPGIPQETRVEHSRRRTLPQKVNDVVDNPGTSMPVWIQAALQANQTYATTEVKIPLLSLSSLDPGQGCHAQEQRNTCDILYDGYGATDSNNTSRRFHKSDLRNAQVVNQVDRKFIACLIDKTGDDGKSGESKVVGSRALVLVDQHAADERVRVERFLKELCSGFLRHRHGTGGVRTRDLSPSLPVLLTRREALHLTGSCSFRQAFESWGFRFGDFPQLEGTPYGSEEGADNSSSSGYVQVLVHSIPEVVSDKLLLGDELRALVKGFLATLETDPSSVFTQQELADEDEYHWLKALRWCPRGLLDLVNSKACRGAIMFNDSLTLIQCERLVRQLSETAFPFQCAHGRPSLVPVANFNLEENNGRRHGARVQWANLGRHSGPYIDVA